MIHIRITPNESLTPGLEFTKLADGADGLDNVTVAMYDRETGDAVATTRISYLDLQQVARSL